MGSCRSIANRTHCAPPSPLADMNLQNRVTTAGKMLKYLISPEASNGDYPHPYPLRPPWMGPVKGLFWAALSIAAGTVLAILCS